LGDHAPHFHNGNLIAEGKPAGFSSGIASDQEKEDKKE
jgi:hypothetical protein